MGMIKSGDEPKGEMEIGGNAAALLDNYKEQIVGLLSERDALNERIKEVVAEAKSNGFSGPTLRKLAAAARADQDKRLEAEAIQRTYLRAVGLKVAE